jgi:AcrR family transcriptional regulator
MASVGRSDTTDTAAAPPAGSSPGSSAAPPNEVVQRLPRGRHGMSRAEVVDAQRQRMLLAMAEAMAADGYTATSVADVIARAGVSRETFYQQFSSKLDCFLVAFDAAGELLLRAVEEQLEPGGEPLEQLEGALRAYLEAIASNPMFARLFLVESVAAGPAMIERRAAVQRRIVRSMWKALGLRTASDRFACELVVLGLNAMAVPLLVAGDVEAIRKLRRPAIAHLRRVLG